MSRKRPPLTRPQRAVSVVRNGERITVINPLVAVAMAQSAAALERAAEPPSAGNITVSELGAVVSEPPPGPRPTERPEGKPVMRKGRWL